MLRTLALLARHLVAAVILSGPLIYLTPLRRLFEPFRPRGFPAPSSPEGYWECSEWTWFAH
jgi:hypothetical protein